MTDTCFICATPYQIIAAVSISHTYKIKSDLYIIPDFAQAKEYEKRIRDLDLFSKVTLVDISRFESYRQSKNRLRYGFGYFFNYFRVNKIVKSIAGDADYKKIYISNHHNIGKYLCIFFLKRGADIVFYDDGVGSYDNPRVYKAFGLEKTVRTILFGKKTVGLSDKRILYCPDLYKKVFGDSDDVASIPNWANDQHLLDLINTICGYDDKAKIGREYVLLDTIPSEDFDSKGQEIYEKLLDICVNSFGKDLVIKKHPRDNREPKYSCEYYKYSDIPFEVICANSDVENKVLICNKSTAAFTPKLVFDLEPTVILLHKITGGVPDDLKTDRFEFDIREMYRMKERFIVPDTMDELVEILGHLKTKNEVNG
ncbi:MAG: hypothetical protein IKG30_04425 [Clostridiales bacterium]|nr:hypothetical protein [Clostridiales bacterium]